MRPGPAAWIIAGRLMVRLTTPIVSSATLHQSAPTPTNTPVPDLQVAPRTAVANPTITLPGSNFTSPSTPGDGGVHQITGSGSSLIVLDGLPMGPPEIDYPVDLDSGGNLLVTVVLPVNSSTIAAGSLVMKVTDSFGQSATANVRIAKRSLSITPAESPRGSTVTAKGAGFPASNSRTTTQTVRLDYGGISVGTATTGPEGSFETTFTVPLAAGIPSSNTVTAAAGATGTATSSHKVPIPTLDIVPGEAVPARPLRSEVPVFRDSPPPPQRISATSRCCPARPPPPWPAVSYQYPSWCPNWRWGYK